jgi:hypothetical protein
LSFNSSGELLLISTEEVSSFFRKVHPGNLVWEAFDREDISEAIAGFWSESGLAITSFLPKELDKKRVSQNLHTRQRNIHLVGRGSLFDLDKETVRTSQDVLELEIPLQNVNFWKNNSRGLNFVYSDNKLIVFKVTD